MTWILALLKLLGDNRPSNPKLVNLMVAFACSVHLKPIDVTQRGNFAAGHRESIQKMTRFLNGAKDDIQTTLRPYVLIAVCDAAPADATADDVRRKAGEITRARAGLL